MQQHSLVQSVSKPVLAFVSVLGTAWLAIGGTVLPLYVNNQESFLFDTAVLHQFAFLVLALSMAALVCLHLSAKKGPRRFFSFLIWLYYLSAVVLIIVSILRTLEFSLALKLLAFGVVSCLTFYVAFRQSATGRLTKVIPSFAALSALFIAVDVVQYGPKVEEFQQTEAIRNVSSNDVVRSNQGDANLPNIYHILLDEFQTDFFHVAATDALKSQLEGFHFFADATTEYGRTGMALPSIFTGASYDPGRPQIEYQERAFNSEASILYWLKQLSYTTSSHAFRLYSFDQTLFDQISHHQKSSTLEHRNIGRSFRHLWVYSNFPAPFSRRLLGAEYVSQQISQNTLPPSSPVSSLNTFRKLINSEKHRGSNGRYQFVHLLLPHFPYVLDKNCEVNDSVEEAPVLGQVQCVLSTLSDFVRELKRRGRYDNSIIIVHSDHGARFDIHDGELRNVQKGGLYSLEFSRARARSLLLVKPAVSEQHSANAAFQVSDYPASLLDIAPTLFGLLGLGRTEQMEGVDLFAPGIPSNERVRHYHFFSKEGRDEWTPSIVRYEIKDKQIKKLRRIPLLNNPQPEP